MDKFRTLRELPVYNLSYESCILPARSVIKLRKVEENVAIFYVGGEWRLRIPRPLYERRAFIEEIHVKPESKEEYAKISSNG